tara:strand:- start:2060 stop:7273 length:5214 start_codon:yes stop_codon:yes gene_type:complete
MSINPCGTDITTAGPFPQTLFMGLSIKSFNLNLGWGGEPSSCSVKLVYDPSHHWSHGSFQGFNSNIESKLNQETKDRASSAFDPEQLKAGTVTPDLNLTLHTGPAKKLQDSESTRDKLKSTYGDIKRNDTGKKIWKTNTETPFNWLGPDPGFLADDLGILRNIVKNSRNLDVMGSMVHFRYDDVIFNGIVKGWNYNNGLVDVQLDSPTNLVKGTKIILKDYTGTISTTIEGAEFGVNSVLAVPYDDPTVGGAFNSTIFNGNIPNLINVFGYLGFENIGYSESRGVSLGLVYDGIVSLLGSAGPVRNKWNPYGCIIGKAVRDRNNAAYLDHGTTLGTTFGDFASDRWNIFNTRSAVDSINRPHIKLDLSSVPRPPNEVYINEVSISLLDFIDKCCEPLGFDYWVELQDKNPGGSYDAVLKVHTVSRRFQPPVNIIKNLVQAFDESDFVTDYKFGQEFQDSKTRSVVMGGKQQRLFQVGTNNLARYRNRRVYEPLLDAYATYNLNNNFNYYREPNTAKPRNLSGSPYYNKGGAVVAQILPNDFELVDTHPQNELPIVRGSYHEAVEPFGQTGSGGRSSSFTPPVYVLGENDYIKPYMGQDVYGNNRTTYFMQGANAQYLGEMFTQIPTYDLAQYFPAGDAPDVFGNLNVSETEIRAAMGGFDSWKNYIFEMPVLGKNIGTSQYIFIYLRDKYGQDFAINFFLNTANVFSGDKGKLTSLSAPRSGGRISMETYLQFSEAISPILSSLHRFFDQLGKDHYGKTFLVRLPNVTSYIDAEGIRRYAYEICDKAWEESGNFIDDTIQIGSTIANQMANEDGTFGAILGFDDTAEYDAYFDEGDIGTSNAFHDVNHTHNKIIASTGKKSPANWYWPLIHDIPRQDIFYSRFQAQIAAPEDAAASQAYFAGAFPTVNPQFPSSLTPHGYEPPGNFRWKMYCKANILDIHPGAVANKNLTRYYGNPHCVLSAPSNIFAVSPNNLSKTMMEEMLVHTRDGMSFANPQLKRIRFAYLLAWARSEKGLSVSSADLANEVGQRQNLPIGLKAAHPLFAAIPLKSNISCYGPWASHPGLGHTNDGALFTDPNPISQINNLVGEVNFSSEPDAQPWNYGGMKNLDDAILTRIKDSNYYQQVLEAGYVTAAGVLFRNTNLGERLASNGPLINALSVQIGDNGFTTTCNMRTYNRKVGFHNKQDADLIQERGRNAVATRQQAAYALRESLLASNSNQGGGGGGDFGGSANAGSNSTGKNSASSLLVGGAAPYLHGTSSLGPDALFGTLGFDPLFPYRPGVPEGIAVSPMQFPMQKAVTMLFDEQDIGNIMTQDFAKKSIMSLDGIFSPISFYPTPYGGTFPMTFYHRSKCPYCGGDGTYTYQQFKPPSAGGGGIDATKNARSSVTKICFFCKPEATANDDKGINNRASPSLVTPPVLLVEAGDDYNVNGGQILGAGNKINKFTLNPIVMTNGEFSLEDAKGEGDTCGHSIDVVAFGEEPPIQGSSLRATSSNFIKKNYDDDNKQLNQRFFGLRGPLMVHGWGYDREGYPVPNASGELKVLNGDMVSITQSLDSNGGLTKPYRLNRFYKGWAQNPGAWPVGPVDLRWDNEAGVWTVGSNYKNVWVTIEIDLKDGQPTRGTVYKDAAEGLPDGLRKLVYVRDSSGGFAAPRGADIYCSYDADSGFYTPLYNQALMASGEIQSATSAKIYQSYKSSYDEDNPTSYIATTSNPLNLDAVTGAVGLFTYINGKWVLTNVK